MFENPDYSLLENDVASKDFDNDEAIPKGKRLSFFWHIATRLAVVMSLLLNFVFLGEKMIPRPRATCLEKSEFGK